MQYLFQHPMPVPWLLADILTLLISLVVVVFHRPAKQTSSGGPAGMFWVRLPLCQHL